MPHSKQNAKWIRWDLFGPKETPETSLGWVGLDISFDDLNQNHQAIVAYAWAKINQNVSKCTIYPNEENPNGHPVWRSVWISMWGGDGRTPGKRSKYGQRAGNSAVTDVRMVVALHMSLKCENERSESCSEHKRIGNDGAASMSSVAHAIEIYSRPWIGGSPRRRFALKVGSVQKIRTFENWKLETSTFWTFRQTEM